MSFPDEMKTKKAWLLWRLEQNKKDPTKWDKVPYYTAGGRRTEAHGSPADRNRLATYDTAAAIIEDDLAGHWAGLGFAMLPDWGIVGLDFDHCVTDGQIEPAVVRAIGATYSEFSPSGTGIHAFLTGSLPDKKSHWTEWGWGFETFQSTAYLTMTGNETDLSALAFSGKLDHVNGAVTELFETRFGAARQRQIVVKTRPRGWDDDRLWSLLLRVTPDGSYHEWASRGMALHHETSGQPRGLRLWDRHSQMGKDYPGSHELEKKWRSFGDRGPDKAEITVAYLESVAALDPDMFDVVPETDLTGVSARNATVVGSAGLVSRVSSVMSTPVRKGIPEAHHLCTDQANAGRLVNAYGKQVLVSTGRWHVWDGRRWVADDSDVYRYACRLSSLIHEEARAVRARASTGDASAVAKAEGIAKALEAWALRSEMKGSIEAAVGLARKMLTVDADLLDADPWLLTTLNGTVDLRTGVLRSHSPNDLITKLVPVDYDPDARCDVWLRVLREICMDDEGVSSFLQRWFGYCLTGMVTEQCFVVHWGAEGSNGKSTVLGLMAETMGDYASTAAPGLMTASKNERHPTEIAALMGRRMVTAHESAQGVVLREDFIKQATGGDRLTARFMREDFFEFSPTHKLQLLTNHKPQITGQDGGIWRRVLLVPYQAAFGSAEQVLAGTHTHVADLDLVERLRGELPGILAWRVRGAMEWAQNGLQAPPVVRSASEEYKREQDRVGQFVTECCDVGPDFSEPLTEGMDEGLYPTYQKWCKEGGVYPVSKARFMDDVVRVVGGFVEKRKVSIGNGRRREVRAVRGLRISTD